MVLGFGSILIVCVYEDGKGILGVMSRLLITFVIKWYTFIKRIVYYLNDFKFLELEELCDRKFKNMLIIELV